MGARIDVAELAPLPAEDMTRDLKPSELEAELTYFVEDAIHNAPRSLQKALGPSEIGTECARRIAYRLADVAPVNEGDGWLATIGTATHAWLERVFSRANQRLGHPRFLCEQRVTVGELAGEPVVGSTDLYDRVTATVVDFKVMGKTSLDSLKKRGPSDQYRSQGHLYGRGWAAAGHPVDRVAIWGLPRNEPLRAAYLWTEAYDERVATGALTRVEGIASLTRAMGTGALALLPTADSYCSYCPFLRSGSTDLTTGCPGHPGSRANTDRPSSVESLIA
jgi:hypothetical protein